MCFYFSLLLFLFHRGKPSNTVLLNDRIKSTCDSSFRLLLFAWTGFVFATHRGKEFTRCPQNSFSVRPFIVNLCTFDRLSLSHRRARISSKRNSRGNRECRNTVRVHEMSVTLWGFPELRDQVTLDTIVRNVRACIRTAWSPYKVVFLDTVQNFVLFKLLSLDGNVYEIRKKRHYIYKY